MNATIEKFLDERKESWLKKNLTANLSEAEKVAIEEDATEKFALQQWLPDAAKRAGQLSQTTHPSKFSHPSSKTSMILAEAHPQPDGFLHSGNIAVEPDVLGNAAALDVNKFLSLQIQDGKSILQHLLEETELIRSELTISTATFEDISQGLLSIREQDTSQITHGKVKQVYFPLPDGSYNLLSVLTPSGLMYELTDRIQTLRFSEETQAARDAKKHNVHHPNGYSELYGLAQIGYGGTKPQNISVLNNEHGGKAYLLPSLPPLLEKRLIHFPKHNFFADTLKLKHFREDFWVWHRILNDWKNNLETRQKRKDFLAALFQEIIQKSWELRTSTHFGDTNTGWSQRETYVALPLHQKIWLDDHYEKERDQQDEWLDGIIKDFLIWFTRAYEKILTPAKAIQLSDDEFRIFRQEINQFREDLR
jgi:CRISPR-associated protein Csy1